MKSLVGGVPTKMSKTTALQVSAAGIRRGTNPWMSPSVLEAIDWTTEVPGKSRVCSEVSATLLRGRLRCRVPSSPLG